METVTCPICKKEGLKNLKALHAHMLKAHIDEYRAKGCKLTNYGLYSKPADIVKTSPPDDLRPLDKSNQLEAVAYANGYRYIAGEECFTSAECKAKGWM